jgi:hypothetical protein
MFAEGGNCRNIGKGAWELSPNFFLDEEPSIPEGFQNLICEYFNQVDASNTK